MFELTVRNPVAELNATTTSRAARAANLEGIELGLWWNKKIGGQVALEWLGEEFQRDFGATPRNYYDSFPAHRGMTDKAAGETQAVIGSTGDCGSCTSWLIHDLVEIESKGTPAVALVGRDFMDDARQTAYVLGMPDLAVVELPRGLTNLTDAEVLELAHEAKPKVLAALTSTTGDGVASHAFPLPTPDVFTYRGSDQFEALAAFQKDFLDQQLGDAFPLTPPTPEAVEAMLEGTRLSADTVVGVLAPAFGNATVEKIAINAVMAGCRAEHLPVVLAATEAIAESCFCLREVAMSTGPHCPLLVINGPIAHRIGVNSGRGALGPSRASAVNVVIGRALRLVMVNCGYAYLGLFDLDTIGTPRKFSYCLAENEEASPFPPLHVDRGFDRDESTVTVFSIGSELDVDDLANAEPETLLLTYAGSAGSAGAPSTQHTYLEMNEGTFKMQNVMLVPPEHAKVIADAGWSKQDAIDFVYQESFREARLVLAACKPQAMRPEKLWAAELDPATRIPSMDGPDSLHLIVVGGAAGKGLYLDGISEPVTKAIAPYLPLGGG